MISKYIVVTNRTGLHARPASSFVTKAKSFSSDISISLDDATANAKSMISVLGLGVDCGAKLLLRATGSDEEKAVSELVALLENLSSEEH